MRIEAIPNRTELLKKLNRRRLDLLRFETLVNPVFQNRNRLFAQFDPEESYALDAKVQCILEQLADENSLISSGRIERSKVQGAIEKATSGFEESEFVIFMCHWQHMGGLRMTGTVLRQVALELLDLDGDTIYGSTVGFERVVLIDFLAEEAGYEISYADRT